jgi:vancomycin permeability regulator SanA
VAQRDYSAHQKNIISNYYKNLDAILLTRLQEVVTELYLADSVKKKTQLWTRVEQSLTKLKIPAEIKAHILEKQDTELLARHLQDWLKP